jgi:acetylornithine deacetylase/succinyl-diaminopimelate desuccinylase-like protein
MSQEMQQIDAFLERTADERMADYIDFLKIPSIGTLSEHDDDTRRAAQFVADHLAAIGFEHVDVSPTGGHPMIYADWLHADGAPTALLYCHYDVQPVDPLDLWKRPPFDPVVENGRIYARGASDDKGNLHLQLWALRAWLETHGRLPLNVRIVFEGEEESGSDKFGPWIKANAGRLAADVAVISDVGFYEGNHAALTVGLRGLIYTQIDVYGSKLDLHSGGFGGNVQNPANALVAILARLRNADGSIAVPGFYDQVRSLTPADHAEFARIPFDEAQFVADHGLLSLFGEPQFTPLERKGARPTLDINGIWGGFEGEGSKTIIPAHAHAKVSCRLVPDMDPERTYQVLADYVKSLAPGGVRVEISRHSDGQWSLTPSDHPATQAAAQVLEEVFGEAPYYLREGGSIPAAAVINHVLGQPLVMLGFAPPDDQAHAPNESMRLDNYENGVRAVARYWQKLAETKL